MATNLTHRDLVDNPIAGVLHIVYVRLKVGYTEQSCIVAGGSALYVGLIRIWVGLTK